MNKLCPLCSSHNTSVFCEDKKREYHQCHECRLVFVPESFWLNTCEEKAEYDLHQNTPDDQGYRRFLSRFADPLCTYLSPPAFGLDFGCGPGPVLAHMLQERGFDMALYDKFYFDNADVLKATYDFICSTEVFEHLHNPRTVIANIIGMLKPGGVLGVMTKRVTSQAAFASWHYKNDPTHIIYFSDETFRYLANHYGLKLDIISKDVVILRKT